MATEAKESNEEQNHEPLLAPEDLANLPQELLIKHPLQNSWTLWFYKNDKSKAWEDNQCEITSFDTVEDFWALYNHIELASKLLPGCDYSLFKQGIKPMWEDDRNRKGGRWLFNLQKQQRYSDLDNFWLETMLCLIGEAFDEQSEEICGAVVNVRAKSDKIAVWTKDCSKSNVMKIGVKLKEALNVSPKVVIGFEAHQDTINKSGSIAKNLYTV